MNRQQPKAGWLETASVMLPALPPWARERGFRSEILRGVLIAAGVGIISIFVGERGILMFLVALPLIAIMILSTLRHLVERDRYEKQLYDLTLQLQSRNQELKELVHIDPLTLVLNRRGLEKALDVEMSRARRNDRIVYAALLDCDDFKQVNERFGHAAGDVVLSTMAQRIKASTRPTDYAARIGGDEFVVLIVDSRPDGAARVAERVRLAISEQPVVHFDQQIVVSASVGIAALPPDTCSIEELLVHCRAALSESKTSGKNKVTVSGRLDRAAILAEKEIVETVRLLETGEGLRSVSQDIVRLSDGQPVGFEMLARGPAGPFELPADLFRLAQDRGILTLVDINCLKLAVRVAAPLAAGKRCHVNLLPSTLVDVSVEALCKLLEPLLEHGLRIEMSGRQFFARADSLLPYVDELRRQGITVGLDDIGNGHSAIEGIVVLEPEFLKLDQSLVKGVASDSHRLRQVERLLAVSRAVGSSLIAVGIENEADLQALKNAGVEYGQGFLWGHPCPDGGEEAATVVGGAENDTAGDACGGEAGGGENKRPASDARPLRSC